MDIVVHEQCFPMINNRTYVHSTSFIKFLLSFYHQIKQLTIKFSKVSRSNCYKFFSSTEPFLNSGLEVSGTVDCKGKIYYYNFKELDIDVNVNYQEEFDVDIDSIKNEQEFVDCIVGHSKSLCNDLYDAQTHMLYMAKIDIMNFNQCIWPIKLTYRLKQIGTRIEVHYFYNDIKVGNLLGLVRAK